MACSRVKRVKRRRGAGTSFGELVQKLWEPEPEKPEPKVATEKLKKSSPAKGKRIRES
jgi:hypothetical protein